MPSQNLLSGISGWLKISWHDSCTRLISHKTSVYQCARDFKPASCYIIIKLCRKWIFKICRTIYHGNGSASLIPFRKFCQESLVLCAADSLSHQTLRLSAHNLMPISLSRWHHDSILHHLKEYLCFAPEIITKDVSRSCSSGALFHHGRKINLLVRD